MPRFKLVVKRRVQPNSSPARGLRPLSVAHFAGRGQAGSHCGVVGGGGGGGLQETAHFAPCPQDGYQVAGYLASAGSHHGRLQLQGNPTFQLLWEKILKFIYVLYIHFFNVGS